MDPLGGATSYAYDTEGNQVAVTDANQNITRYVHDQLNRLVETATPLFNRTKFSYDPAGNRLSTTDANGNTTNYAYDANNRLTLITYPDNSSVMFAYDAVGNQISMTDSRGTTIYTYDELDRLIQEDGPANKDTIAYTYDAVGNRLQMSDPDGGVTSYAYDALNRLASLTNPQSLTTTYSYDELGNLIQMNYPNGTQAAYRYDSLNRLIELANTRTGLSSNPKPIISSYAYEYDAAGRRTKVMLETGDSILYSYDPLNRLIKEIKKMGDSGRTFYSYTYAYDAVGNRTSLARTLYQRMPTPQAGLLAEDLPGANEYAYTYNAENQLLSTNITRSTRTPVPPANAAKPAKYKGGQLLVKFKAGTDAATMTALNTKYGTAVMKKIPRLNVFRLRIKTGVDPSALAAAYKTEPAVAYAEPNFLVQAVLLTPNDPSFSQQWALHNTGQTGGTPDSDIDAPEAWDLKTGDPNLRIALVDTGVDLDHPDLAGKVISGRDFENNDDIPQDDHGHGTFLAGIVAAVTDNNTGIAGTSWQGQILAIKALNFLGAGNIADVAEGMVYAADNGADIINLSLGSPNPSSTLEGAVHYAFNKGVVLVASAGNDNGPVIYPAAYETYVLAVAATDHNDNRASFSSFGPEVDVAAPWSRYPLHLVE